MPALTLHRWAAPLLAGVLALPVAASAGPLPARSIPSPATLRAAGLVPSVVAADSGRAKATGAAAAVPVETPAAAPAAARGAAASVASVRARARAIVPVRLTIAQSTRRVVLLPGVSEAEPVVLEPVHEASAPIDGARTIYVRAIVRTLPGGQRDVVYLETPNAPLGLGASVSCGADVLQATDALGDLRRSPLRLGSSGTPVETLQRMLCAAGYTVDLDGEFDRETDVVVRQAQTDHNGRQRQRAQRIRVDGVVGPRTRAAIEAAIRAKVAG